MSLEFDATGEKQVKAQSAETAAQSRAEDPSRSFLHELSMDPLTPYYHARPEYSNGLASQDLIGVEEWVDDEKHCSTKIDQDQLETRLSNFAAKTDDRWHKMENSGKQAFNEMSKDEYLTYPRFGDLFELLDDKHQDNLLKTLPWTLRPGE